MVIRNGVRVMIIDLPLVIHFPKPGLKSRNAERHSDKQLLSTAGLAGRRLRSQLVPLLRLWPHETLAIPDPTNRRELQTRTALLPAGCDLACVCPKSPVVARSDHRDPRVAGNRHAQRVRVRRGSPTASS